MSQVVLSVALPVPMIALIIFAGRRDVMGDFAIGRGLRLLASLAAVVVLTLNAVLLAETFGLSLPLLSPG